MCVLLPGGSYTREPYLGRGSFPHKLSKYRASAGAVAVPPPLPPSPSCAEKSIRPSLGASSTSSTQDSTGAGAQRCFFAEHQLMSHLSHI